MDRAAELRAEVTIGTGHNVLRAGDVLGEARNSDEMLAIWRATRERIGLSNAHCDELANFTLGQTDKCLGPTGTKKFGPLIFTGFNWTFAIKWVAVVDADQLQIVEQYWKDRQRQVTHVRPTSRISKALLERARPIVLKEFGEKLALVLGDDVGQLLLGMKPPDQGDQPASTVEPVAAVEQADPPYGAFAPVSPPPAPASRAHLRVIQTKSGRKFG
jgi:hypothetical protein